MAEEKEGGADGQFPALDRAPGSKAAAAASVAGTQASSAAAAEVAEGDEAAFVLNRPYSAGETPEIVRATVLRVRDAAAQTVDLEYFDGKTVSEAVGVPYSERREPGTWHVRAGSPKAERG